MNRLLREADLDQYRAWAKEVPGAGTGRVPTDLLLLLEHMDAQMAELRRAREQNDRLADVVDELLDYIEHGGSDALRDEVVARARATRGQ